MRKEGDSDEMMLKGNENRGEETRRSRREAEKKNPTKEGK